MIDPWTAVHVAVGLAAGLVGLPLRWLLVGSVAYELFEQAAERESWGQRLLNTSGPESPLNAVADVVAACLGHDLGRRWNETV